MLSLSGLLLAYAGWTSLALVSTHRRAAIGLHLPSWLPATAAALLFGGGVCLAVTTWGAAIGAVAWLGQCCISGAAAILAFGFVTRPTPKGSPLPAMRASSDAGHRR